MFHIAEERHTKWATSSRIKVGDLMLALAQAFHRISTEESRVIATKNNSLNVGSNKNRTLHLRMQNRQVTPARPQPDEFIFRKVKRLNGFRPSIWKRLLEACTEESWSP